MTDNGVTAYQNAPFIWLTISSSFQTKLMTDVKSIAIVPMHEWKMPPKYWGVLSS